MPRFVYRPTHPEADVFGMVESQVAGPKHVGDPAPNVIGDTMALTRHMANGKHYDSKSQFREATKAAGCIEVGNETGTLLKPRAPAVFNREHRRQEVRQAIRRKLRGE